MTFTISSFRQLLRSREEIFQDASEGRKFDAFYFAMLVLSCLIALLGLLLNSPAVIIGAMLISPLMGPILSCGLALTTADAGLGKKAGWNVVLSVAEVILISAIATWLSPLKNATPEILARTNPNLMDLLVAFFSGLAGTLAMSSRKAGMMILPGVAIATAVIPPLAIIGYGVSTARWALARGASMLFITNFTAIVISAELIFFLVGFRPSQRAIPEGARLLVRYRTWIAFGVLMALSIPLVETLMHAAQQVELRQMVWTALGDEVKKSGQRLDSVDLQIGQSGVVVEAAVRTEHFIEDPEIRQWENVLSTRTGKPVRLDLQQLQLAQKETGAPLPRENRDYLAGGLIQPPKAEPPLSTADEVEKLQKKIDSSLRALLSPAGVTPLQIRSMGRQANGTLLLELTGQEAATLDETAWKIAAAGVANGLGSPVRLTGSMVVANATHTIAYAPGAVRPRQKDLRSAQRFLAQWKGQSGLAYTFLAPQPLDSKSSQRLAWLRTKFPDSISEPIAGNPAADSETQPSVRIQIIQAVDATAGMATDSGKALSGVEPPAAK